MPLTPHPPALQVDKAFEYMEAFEGSGTPDVRYDIRVKRADSTERRRGIYLREPLDSTCPVSFVAEVLPMLHEVGCRQGCLQPSVISCG